MRPHLTPTSPSATGTEVEQPPDPRRLPFGPGTMLKLQVRGLVQRAKSVMGFEDSDEDSGDEFDNDEAGEWKPMGNYGNAGPKKGTTFKMRKGTISTEGLRLALAAQQAQEADELAAAAIERAEEAAARAAAAAAELLLARQELADKREQTMQVEAREFLMQQVDAGRKAQMADAKLKLILYQTSSDGNEDACAAALVKHAPGHDGPRVQGLPNL